MRDGKGKPAPRAQHEVEIHLTHDYPRLSPMCRMLTPIFHPNIDGSTICVGWCVLQVRAADTDARKTLCSRMGPISKMD